jgi:integrase
MMYSVNCQFQKITKMKTANTSTKVSCILKNYFVGHVSDQCIDHVRQELCIRQLSGVLGDKDISELTAEVISAYKKGRKHLGRPVSQGTLRRELNVLVAAINFAVKQRQIRRDDVPDISLPHHSPPKDFFLTEEELSLFMLEASKTSRERLSRIHKFVWIAAETAARKSSIINLKWSQVDFGSGIINFQNDGKIQKCKKRVPVPISDRLMPLLEQACSEASASPKTEEYVLEHTGQLRYDFDRICDRLGGRFCQVTPHTLRHTWATLAARSGKVPIWQIAGVLGDSIQTVTNNYLHHCPKHLREAVNFR